MDDFMQCRQESLRAVLQQQSIVPQHVRQKDEFIASAYHRESIEAHNEAFQRAKLDRQAVKLYAIEGCDIDTVRREQHLTMEEEGDIDTGKGKRKVIKRLLSSFRMQ